jgi:hypothetical protein
VYVQWGKHRFSIRDYPITSLPWPINAGYIKNAFDEQVLIVMSECRVDVLPIVAYARVHSDTLLSLRSRDVAYSAVPASNAPTSAFSVRKGIIRTMPTVALAAEFFRSNYSNSFKSQHRG